jgi:2-keto-4-pentenoate hydratase/2-oxohepta-3-ene-1,7-dioic acid hydratase in catechol pathway
MFFTKSSASITGPTGSIVKPDHVDLLDYEIELVLVMAKKNMGSVHVTKENISEYVAGICIGNDVSARDVQIPQMQFFKGKSYRTFCPLGPVLCLLDPWEMPYLNDLDLTLKVNGEVRQSDNTRNLVFKPAETLTEYSQIVDFEPGDVVMTGTPSGCALSLPSPLAVKLSALLPERKKWELFIKTQKKRERYLKVGDSLELSIRSRDGHIDLGKQTHVITGV